MNRFRIILADDSDIYRNGLRSSMEKEEEVDIVGIADSGGKAVELANRLRPDVVIMDVDMPQGLSGLEATRRILSLNLEIKVIACSMYLDKIHVKGMLNAGASAYVSKNCSMKEMLKGIKIVVSGKRFFCREVRRLYIGINDNKCDKRKGNKRKKKRDGLSLSRRQLDVLQLISEGFNREQIAKKLNISIKTVDIHRANLKAKLNVNTATELTRAAVLYMTKFLS